MGDVARFASPDVAETCVDAIKTRFPSADFVLDDVHAPFPLEDLLEAADGDDA